MKRLIALVATLLSLPLVSHADLTQVAPPQRGDPPQAPLAWKSTAKNLVKAERHFAASTLDAPRKFPHLIYKPNAQMEKLFKKTPELYKFQSATPGGSAADFSSFSIQANPLLTNWADIPQTNLTPPDNNIAVGHDYIVSVVNSTFRISNKCGDNLYENTINSFLSDGGFLFDPKVFYDPWRNRYSMLWLRRDTAAGQAHLVTVSSDDADPFGTWWVYYFRIDSNSTTWTDYADWGYGQNAVCAAGDQFSFGNSFQNTRFYIFNPTQIYSNGGASVSWRTVTTNPDGSQCFAPRVCRMMYSGNGGFWLLNSRVGGGSRITIWSLTDPLGAFNLSGIDTNVAAYAVPPDATDPGGNIVQTNACQMMNAVYTLDPVANRLALYSSLNAQNPSEPAQCAARLYILDPNGTVYLDWNFWASGSSSFYASPAVNYDGNCNWVFSRCGPAIQAQARYVNFESTTGFSNSSGLLAAGTSNYAGSRWGDYHGGDTDWGDFFNQGGTGGKQKMWFNGEHAGGLFDWRTRTGAVVQTGVTPGTLAINTNTNMFFSGYSGFGYSPANIDTTLSNTGQVGCNFEVTGPAWVNLTNTAGQLYSGQNVIVSTSPANQPYGRYTGLVRFTNCYDNTSVTRPVELESWAYVTPTSIAVRLGRIQSGNVASLGFQDGNYLTVCKFIVPNQTVPPVQVEVNGTAPGNTASLVYFFNRAKMANNGLFRIRTEMWNWALNNWDPTDFNDQVINTSLGTFDQGSTGNDNRFIGAGNALRAKYSIRQTGPASTPVWCVDTDVCSWALIPQ